MLNVDLKIISKALSEKLVLPDIISSQQMTYVNNRHIGESRRLISDKNKKNGKILVTMDIKKAFDSLDHNFLISAVEKYGFAKNFISWVNVLLRNQEYCVLNDGTTTKYFLLGRRASQGDPISAFLFILALETLFYRIKLKLEIKGLAIFDHCYLYYAYADDTIFLLQDGISNIWLMPFFEFFGIKTKPNKI